MEMTGLTIGVLEPESPLAKVDLAGDARINHPLQGAIHRCTADAVIITSNEIDQIVGAEMAFLSQEDVDNLLALAGALATGWLQPSEIWNCVQRLSAHLLSLTFDAGRARSQALNDCPHPHVDVAFGFLMVNPPPVTVSTKSTSAPLR